MRIYIYGILIIAKILESNAKLNCHPICCRDVLQCEYQFYTTSLIQFPLCSHQIDVSEMITLVAACIKGPDLCFKPCPCFVAPTTQKTLFEKTLAFVSEVMQIKEDLDTKNKLIENRNWLIDNASSEEDRFRYESLNWDDEELKTEYQQLKDKLKEKELQKELEIKNNLIESKKLFIENAKSVEELRSFKHLVSWWDEVELENEDSILEEKFKMLEEQEAAETKPNNTNSKYLDGEDGDNLEKKKLLETRKYLIENALSEEDRLGYVSLNWEDEELKTEYQQLKDKLKEQEIEIKNQQISYKMHLIEKSQSVKELRELQQLPNWDEVEIENEASILEEKFKMLEEKEAAETKKNNRIWLIDNASSEEDRLRYESLNWDDKELKTEYQKLKDKLEEKELERKNELLKTKKLLIETAQSVKELRMFTQASRWNEAELENEAFLLKEKFKMLKEEEAAEAEAKKSSSKYSDKDIELVQDIIKMFFRQI